MKILEKKHYMIYSQNMDKFTTSSWWEIPTQASQEVFAYVNFIQMRDAENAKHLANFELLGRKHIRIMYKNPNIKQLPPSTNLFIKNIDKTANVKDLHSEFLQFGSIVSAKLAVDEKGDSLCYGYVQFEQKESVLKVLLKANAVIFPNVQAQVNEQAFIEELKVNPNLKLTGSILAAEIVRTENDGYAAVVFEKKEDVKQVLDNVPGTQSSQYLFKGKPLDIVEFKARTERPQTQKNNLYLRGFPDPAENVKLDDLKNQVKDYFTKHYGS